MSALASLPSPASPASFRSWPRRMTSPLIGTSCIAGSRYGRGDGGDQPFGLALDLPPRHPDHPEPLRREVLVLAAIALEGPARPVEGVAVELDHEARVVPDGVDFEAGSSGVR